MRCSSVLALFILTITCGGCHKHTLAEFHFKPGMTAQDYEDQIGSPTRVSPTWVGYTLKDGNELRMYFLEGPIGTVRSLSEADVYNSAGMRIDQLFKLKNTKTATQPSVSPVTNPSTAPTTLPTSG